MFLSFDKKRNFGVKNSFFFHKASFLPKLCLGRPTIKFLEKTSSPQTLSGIVPKCPKISFWDKQPKKLWGQTDRTQNEFFFFKKVCVPLMVFGKGQPLVRKKLFVNY